MRFTVPPKVRQHRQEAGAIAIAAIGIGMFIGSSLIGPLVSHDDVDRPAEVSAATSFEAMTALPDPFPFRTPTPAFDVTGAPSYAAAAKEKAQAELGGQPSADGDWQAQDRAPEMQSRRGRYRLPDRHTSVF